MNKHHLQGFFAIFIPGILLVSLCHAESISLSDSEYKNIGVIDKALRAKYNQFKGFNGSKQNMEIIGLPAAAVREEINKIDLLKLESDAIDQDKEVLAVRGKMIDMAIADCEKSGALKYKDKVKEKLLSEVK